MNKRCTTNSEHVKTIITVLSIKITVKVKNVIIEKGHLVIIKESIHQ